MIPLRSTRRNSLRPLQVHGRGRERASATQGSGPGDVLALAIDPSNPSTIYAVQDGSGGFSADDPNAPLVWRSTDGGETWTQASFPGLSDVIASGDSSTTRARPACCTQSPPARRRSFSDLWTEEPPGKRSPMGCLSAGRTAPSSTPLPAEVCTGRPTTASSSGCPRASNARGKGVRRESQIPVTWSSQPVVGGRSGGAGADRRLGCAGGV